MIGKTLVSSSIIDRVAEGLGRRLVEVPVGFKWFVPGLLSGEGAFGGEESAGASFLQLDGSVWTTDKDGILLALLASEITAVTGKSPSQLYGRLTGQFGDAGLRPDRRRRPPGSRRRRWASSPPSDVTATELAGEPITAKLTEAPGNGAAIGGLKVVTENAWFAARPSGTEDVYKIYAESFKGPEHLQAGAGRGEGAGRRRARRRLSAGRSGAVVVAYALHALWDHRTPGLLLWAEGPVVEPDRADQPDRGGPGGRRAAAPAPGAPVRGARRRPARPARRVRPRAALARRPGHAGPVGAAPARHRAVAAALARAARPRPAAAGRSARAGAGPARAVVGRRAPVRACGGGAAARRARRSLSLDGDARGGRA